MENFGWPTLLFLFKWLLLGLVYFALYVVLATVRRELRTRLPTAAEPAPASAPARLVVIQPGSDPRLKPGEVLALLPETSVGAEPENDLVFGDRYISRRHARLRYDGIRWWLEDLGSRNGTFLDGARLDPHRAQVIGQGARIAMGEIILEMQE